MAVNWLSRSHVLIADGWQPDVGPHTARENAAYFKAAMQVQVRAGARILRADGPEALLLCRQLEIPGLVVWATLGPSGKLLPLREIEPQVLQDEYERRLAPLAELQPDALWVQSLHDLDEAIIALQAAKSVCSLPVGLGLVFGSGAEGVDTVLGNSCDEAAARLQEAGAQWVGACCRLSIDDMVLAVRLMREKSTLPIAAFPDAAQCELDAARIVYRETPAEFAAKSESLVAAGASIIGGCCGVSPEHIKALAQAIAST